MPFTKDNNTSIINSRIYQGWVRHRRYLPKKNEFQYTVFQVWLDLDEADNLHKLCPFWSSNRFNLVQFRRKDYMAGEPDLKQTIIDRIQQETGKSFSGKIYLLTNLRYYGYCFNPVSYYFCYNENQQLEFILSEVNNTPWNERHTYIHQLSPSQKNHAEGDSLQFNHKKEFHVSPFMPMNLDYKSLFNIKPSALLIHMQLFKQDDFMFDATMNLKGKPLTRLTAWLVPFKYPLMCFKVVAGIYWQALKIWLIKGIAYIPHPSGKHRTKS